VGDYAEDSDLAPEWKASTIYGRCRGDDEESEGEGEFTDISADVARVIEHELGGKYTGTGWRNWEAEGAKETAIKPDMILGFGGKD
jgi:hypothetical protein